MFVSGARGLLAFSLRPNSPTRVRHERIMITDALEALRVLRGAFFFLVVKPMETVYLNSDKTKTFDSP